MISLHRILIQLKIIICNPTIIRIHHVLTWIILVRIRERLNNIRHDIGVNVLFKKLKLKCDFLYINIIEIVYLNLWFLVI
jgi:hypothetical protein